MTLLRWIPIESPKNIHAEEDFWEPPSGRKGLPSSLQINRMAAPPHPLLVPHEPRADKCNDLLALRSRIINMLSESAPFIGRTLKREIP